MYSAYILSFNPNKSVGWALVFYPANEVKGPGTLWHSTQVHVAHNSSSRKGTQVLLDCNINVLVHTICLPRRAEEKQPRRRQKMIFKTSAPTLMLPTRTGQIPYPSPSPIYDVDNQWVHPSQATLTEGKPAEMSRYWDTPTQALTSPVAFPREGLYSHCGPPNNACLSVAASASVPNFASLCSMLPGSLSVILGVHVHHS